MAIVTLLSLKILHESTICIFYRGHTCQFTKGCKKVHVIKPFAGYLIDYIITNIYFSISE